MQDAGGWLTGDSCKDAGSEREGERGGVSVGGGDRKGVVSDKESQEGHTECEGEREVGGTVMWNAEPRDRELRHKKQDRRTVTRRNRSKVRGI